MTGYFFFSGFGGVRLAFHAASSPATSCGNDTACAITAVRGYPRRVRSMSCFTIPRPSRAHMNSIRLADSSAATDSGGNFRGGGL